MLDIMGNTDQIRADQAYRKERGTGQVYMDIKVYKAKREIKRLRTKLKSS